ncbi:MAG: heparinase II/III-family protein, partial [Bacteroidetes bacterium]|nr:heparinase II/III-family protein [Bacteroidota bacterium]
VRQTLQPKSQYHPYPTTPAEWQKALPDSILKALVKAGEASLDYQFQPVSATVSLDFVRSGDRERHRGVAYNKRYALTDLLLAESVEGKGRFMEAILNGVWSICEESFWGVPAHIRDTGLPDVENPVVELFSAETAALMGLADYFVGDKLDAINPLVRKRMYYETNRRIFEPMLTNTDQYSWMSKTRSVNNWNPWIMSNWMSAALMLEKDEARRANMIHQSMLGLDLYLNGLGEDGGCDEGPSYWTAAGASVYDCLELLGNASQQKIQIYDLPLIQKMASYFYKVHIDGHYFVNFSDADPKLRPDGLLLYRFGKALNDPQMVSMGHWAFRKFPERTLEVNGHHRPRSIENLLTIKNMNTPTQAYVPVRDAWISDIQVMTARADNGFVLATHGGHNAESHNHNDVGDFLLYANGEPVIIDAGRGNYTARTFSPQRYELWFTQSQHHNLPIINGHGQQAGRSAEATEVSSSINDKEAALNMNIDKAYPAETGVTSWKRKVALNRQKNRLEITDAYAMQQKPSSIQQVFMTICEVDTQVPGQVVLTTPSRRAYVLRYDPKQWKVATEFPSTDGMEYNSFKTKWDNHPVQRILLTNKSLKAKDQFVFTVENK